MHLRNPAEPHRWNAQGEISNDLTLSPQPLIAPSKSRRYKTASTLRHRVPADCRSATLGTLLACGKDWVCHMWRYQRLNIRKVKGQGRLGRVQSSAIRNDLPALKTRVNLLLASLNRCLDRGLLRGKSIRHVELSLGHATRIMFLDGELRRESAVS